MNQHQRKYLTDRIDQVWRSQKDAIEEHRTDKPSLNNHVVAAFMDGSIRMKKLGDIGAYLRERVLSGDNEVIDNGYSRHRDKEVDMVKLPFDQLFETPPTYIEALAKWQKHDDELEAKLATLTAQRDTINMKVNIGSDKALASLIAEADNLTDLTLVNNKLLLNA